MSEIPKKNTFFFCTSEREYLKTEGLKVRLSEQNPTESKKKYQISFWILEREYLGPSGQRYELASEVQITLCFSEREYLPLTQIVIKVWLGFAFLIILDFLRF